MTPSMGEKHSTVRSGALSVSPLRVTLFTAAWAVKRFDSGRTSRTSVAYEICTPSRMSQKPSVNFMIFLGWDGSCRMGARRPSRSILIVHKTNAAAEGLRSGSRL
ncbi:hypothetical protein ACVILE_005937 [Streptomyces sp. M18.1]